MKAQDAPRTSTLRMVKAAVMNREIEKGGEMDDEEMMKLLAPSSNNGATQLSSMKKEDDKSLRQRKQ